MCNPYAVEAGVYGHSADLCGSAAPPYLLEWPLAIFCLVCVVIELAALAHHRRQTGRSAGSLLRAWFVASLAGAAAAAMLLAVWLSVVESDQSLVKYLLSIDKRIFDEHRMWLLPVSAGAVLAPLAAAAAPVKLLVVRREVAARTALRLIVWTQLVSFAVTLFVISIVPWRQ